MRQIGEKRRLLIFWCACKLRRKDQCRPKNSFSWGESRLFMWCGSESQKHPRKMSNPIWGRAASNEGCLQATVKSFNHAIGLGMKCCGGNVRNVEQLGKLTPQRRGKLCPSVCGESVRNTKTSNPG